MTTRYCEGCGGHVQESRWAEHKKECAKTGAPVYAPREGLPDFDKEKGKDDLWRKKRPASAGGPGTGKRR